MALREFNLKQYQKITDRAELKKTMFIQASAGTGKTYTITGIIKKLVEENFDLKKILVVTYTEKAAGELRDRIRKACPDKDVDNAPIYTIHSFCQQTLSEFSFTANQCANLALVDDGSIDGFLDGWIRDSLKQNSTFETLFESSDKQSTFINNIKRDFKQAVSKYYLNEQGKEVIDIVSLDTTNFTMFHDQTITFDDFESLSNLDSIETLFMIDGFEDNWRDLEANLQARKAEDFRNDILLNINQNHTFDYNWHSFKVNYMGDEIKETFKYFQAFRKDFKALMGECDSIPGIEFYNSQIKKLYLAWQQEKEKNKMQSYNDLLRNVREAVCSKNSNLKKQLQKKYDFAIIDEFQDTNQKQWDIFTNIFMEDDDHTIIVVGDPKQSIYSFEGADVNVYNKAINSIADNKGLSCNLSTNFRSTDAMVRGCNFLFQNFFNPDSGITFTDSKPSRTKGAATYDDNVIKPIWIAGNAENYVSEEEFAMLTAQTIVDCCTWKNGKTKLQVFDKDKEDADGNCFELRNVTFRDFAVLVRSSSEFEATEIALKKAGIPFLRYKDANLFYGNECTQWISLFNAIIAKDFTGHNRAILSEALFTDFFGIQLEKLENEKYDNPSCPERQMIIQWQQLAQKRKWAKLLERIFADTDIESKLSQLDKLQTLSKIRQIGNYTVDYLYKTDSSLEDACKHLLRLSNDADDSLDEGSLVEKGTDFDSVQLMTIHASKGLEFPVVIVPAGLKARYNNTPTAYLYHDENNNAKLSFSSSYGKVCSTLEDDFERERIYYVAYTRASSLLMLPVYDVWDSEVSTAKASIHEFLKNNITALFDAVDENGNSFVKEVRNNNKDFDTLKNDVKQILQETKKIREEQNSSSSISDITEEAQRSASKELSEKIPKRVLHKHSYVSLSHKKSTSEEMTVNGATGRNNKEGESNKDDSLAEFDTAPNPVNYTAIPGTNDVCAPAPDAPNNYPNGIKLGIALHEVFEKAPFDMKKDTDGLNRLITACFEKQTLKIPENDPTHWLTYTTALLWNTFNAKFPEIIGGAQTGKYFKLSELPAADRISEAEFNMNADITAADISASSGISASSPAVSENSILKNYCNGFIDLVFKRNINGKEVYSILDWKSDSFDADKYSNAEKLKSHTDDRYSIQRVLYSYSLIKWLSTFYKDEYKTDTEAKVFENNFGGIYYVYVRGCQADTCSGIYARTWTSWQELENAFKNILKEFHIAG